MSFKEIKAEDLQFNPFTRIGSDWMLITAGDEKKFNTMTASWGGAGVFWGKNVVTCYIRPSATQRNLSMPMIPSPFPSTARNVKTPSISAALSPAGTATKYQRQALLRILRREPPHLRKQILSLSAEKFIRTICPTRILSPKKMTQNTIRIKIITRCISQRL